MSEKRYFGITTPLYYANDIPHIGHAYCTIAVDAIARFHRSLGEEVYFITGSDEHGQKINRAAEEVGKQPIDHANEMSNTLKNYGINLKSTMTVSCEQLRKNTTAMSKRL